MTNQNYGNCRATHPRAHPAMKELVRVMNLCGVTYLQVEEISGYGQATLNGWNAAERQPDALQQVDLLETAERILKDHIQEAAE